MDAAAWSHYPPSAAAESKQWLGIVAMSVGIALAAASLIFGLLTSIPGGIAAVVFGHLGLKDAKRHGTTTGFSIAGLVIGYGLLAFSLAAIVVVAFIFFVMVGAGSAA